MKLVFINPPNTYELIGNDPVVIKDQQGIYPPLGILYMAAYLQNTNRYDVRVIDAQAENLTHEEVADKVAEMRPDLVGIMAMTFTLIDCKLVVQEVRKRVKTTIVVGGPHTAIYPEECFSKEGLNADYVVVGEGECTMDRLAQDICQGKARDRIYRQTAFIEDLDALPFAARELTPIEDYYSVLAQDTPTTTMFTSRGCPFSCSFCDRPALGKGFRPQGPMRVVDEMEYCERKLHIKEIFFYDDTFSVSMKRVMKICDEYKKRKLTIKWDVRTRVNVVNEELLKNMKSAGCERIHFGVESGVPRIIREIQKGITMEQVDKAFDMCQRLNIKTLAYFMMGNPTETFDDVKETLRVAHRIKPDFMQMTILSPFPATQVYLRAMQEGVIKGDPWRDYSKTIHDDFRPPLWDLIYSRNELESQLRWFYKNFYLQPGFIWERLMEVRNFGQFKRYFFAGLSIAKMALVPEHKLKDSWQLRNATDTANSKAPVSALDCV